MAGMGGLHMGNDGLQGKAVTSAALWGLPSIYLGVMKTEVMARIIKPARNISRLLCFAWDRIDCAKKSRVRACPGFGEGLISLLNAPDAAHGGSADRCAVPLNPSTALLVTDNPDHTSS